MIFNLTETGSNKVHRYFLERARLAQTTANNPVSTRVLSDTLTADGVRHEVKMIPSCIDVDDFLNGRSNDVVNFILQTKIENLAADLRDGILDVVRQGSTRDTATGRYLFQDRTGMILIGSD